MPRNEERFGADNLANKSETIQQEETKSILDFVLPTELVDIPSKGKYYPPDHPLHGQESVEIRYMTAKDTDILTSKNLIKKGVAIDRMLQGVIVDKNIKVEDLYVGDKNALIVASRINGFGPSYETKISCPSCEETLNHTFDLSEIFEEIEEDEEEKNVSQDGIITIELPVTKATVKCRLMTGKDEKNLLLKSQKRKKNKLSESTLTDQYKMIVVSVNDVEERGLVEKFVDVMPARDSSYLKAEYNKNTPNIDLSHIYLCENCGEESNITIPFSANFFWT